MEPRENTSCQRKQTRDQLGIISRHNKDGLNHPGENGERTRNTEKNQWHCQASGSDSLLSPSLWDLLRCLSSLSHLSVSFQHNLPEAQTYLVMGYRPSAFCIPTGFPQFKNCGNRTCVGHLLPNPLRKIRDMYVLHNTCSFIIHFGTSDISCYLLLAGENNLRLCIHWMWGKNMFCDHGGTKEMEGVSNEKSATFLSIIS